MDWETGIDTERWTTSKPGDSPDHHGGDYTFFGGSKIGHHPPENDTEQRAKKTKVNASG